MMCRKAVEGVTDEDEGSLSGWRSVSYRFHMAICPYCRAHRDQMRKTVETLSALPKPPPSGGALERATEAFKKSRQGASKP